MRLGHGVAAALGLLWVVSCALGAKAEAQDAGVADAGGGAAQGVLALSVGPDVVEREALRLALEAELGVAVVDAGSAPAYMAQLSVLRVDNGNVEVALSSRTLPRSTREFALTAQVPEERVEMVTLIAANLVRNEASALLPELQKPPPPPLPEPAPQPEVRPMAPPPAQLADPCETQPPREFGIDLAPGVGASSNPRGRTATRAVSLSFAGTLYDRLHGFELSYTGANIVRKSVCGVQITAGANVSWGPTVGAQLATFNLVKGRFSGAQLGLVHVTIGDLKGVQLGLVAINHGELRGVQLGLTSYARHHLVGLQAGLLNIALDSLKGMQLGVANYVGGDLRGMQLSVLNLALHNVLVGQLGVVNYAGSVTGKYRLPRFGKKESRERPGAQLGVVNISRGPVEGVQLGVLNYADRSTASIGLLSIVRHGRTSIDLTGTIDSSLLMTSVTHGGRYIHNILGVGMRANPGDTRLASVFGIGVRALRTRWLRLDVDLLSQHVYNDDIEGKGISMIASARVPVTLMVWKGLGVMAAFSYNFSIIDRDETRALHNFGSTHVHRGDPNVRAFPGATFGLRYEFDHGL